jgi:hypothetical protein
MKIAALAMAIAVGVVGAATAARADVITTYTFINTFTGGGGVLSGSFQIDQTLLNEATETGYVAGSSSLEIAGDSSRFSSFINGAYAEFDFFDGDFVDFSKQRKIGISIFVDIPPQRTGLIAQNDAGHVNLNPFTINGELLASTASTTTDTPEPSTWAMMLIGFVGLGYVGYRRSTRLA